MKCLTCGSENSADAKFCRVCGAILTPQQGAEMPQQGAGMPQQNNMNSAYGNNMANTNTGYGYGGVMTTGCKIWFWLVMIVNILSALSSLGRLVSLSGWAFMSIAFKLAFMGVIGGIVLAAGSALILFKQKKIGLYMIIVMAVIICVVNIACHMNIIFALVSAALNPLISFFFVRKNSDVIR